MPYVSQGRLCLDRPLLFFVVACFKSANTKERITSYIAMRWVGIDGGTAAAAVAASAAAAPNVGAERVDVVKARLATLFSHKAELDVELSELEAAVESVKAKRDAVRAERPRASSTQPSTRP